MKNVTAALVASVIAGGLVAGGSVPSLGAAAASASTVKSCGSAQIAVAAGKPQGTAGTTYVPITFTNKGARCAIWGVPEIQPVTGAARHAVGPLARNLSMGEMPVRQTVAKGAAVSVAFGVADTGNYAPSTCAARSASGVVVALGSFVHAAYVHLPITVCTKRSSVTTRLIVPGVNGY